MTHKVKIEILSKVTFKLNESNLNDFSNDKYFLKYSNYTQKLLKAYIQEAINKRISDFRLFLEMLENYLWINNKKLSLNIKNLIIKHFIKKDKNGFLLIWDFWNINLLREKIYVDVEHWIQDIEKYIYNKYTEYYITRIYK